MRLIKRRLYLCSFLVTATSLCYCIVTYQVPITCCSSAINGCVCVCSTYFVTRGVGPDFLRPLISSNFASLFLFTDLPISCNNSIGQHATPQSSIPLHTWASFNDSRLHHWGQWRNQILSPWALGCWQHLNYVSNKMRYKGLATYPYRFTAYGKSYLCDRMDFFNDHSDVYIGTHATGWSTTTTAYALVVCNMHDITLLLEAFGTSTYQYQSRWLWIFGRLDQEMEYKGCKSTWVLAYIGLLFASGSFYHWSSLLWTCVAPAPMVPLPGLMRLSCRADGYKPHILTTLMIAFRHWRVVMNQAWLESNIRAILEVRASMWGLKLWQ